MDLDQENININNFNRKDKNLLSNDNIIKLAENKSNKCFENNSKSNKSNIKENVDKYKKELTNYVESLFIQN